MKLFTKFAIVYLITLGMLAGCSSTPDKKKDTDPVEEQADAQPETSAQELFIQGNKALDEKDFEAAVSLYDKALERDDARWDIYMNKAIAHSAQQQFSKAIEAIDKALANGGDKEAQVYFNLGNIYQNRGLYAQSVKAYRTSLAVAQKPDPDTLLNLGAALALMREYDKAVVTYEHVRSLAPDDPRVYVGRGTIAQARGYHEKALEFYEQAHQVDPNYEQAWFNKAALLMDMDRNDEAIQSYQKYLQLAPEGPYAERARLKLQHLNPEK